MTDVTKDWIRITAKFDSSCISCGNEILTDDMILWKKGHGVKHQSCPNVSSNNDNSGITVIDENSYDTPKTWIDSKKYSYKELQLMNKCQCCGNDVSDRSKRYIDDDRLVCVNCFG